MAPPYTQPNWVRPLMPAEVLERDPINEKAITILNTEEQALMRAAGKLARKALQLGGSLVEVSDVIGFHSNKAWNNHWIH